MLLLFLFCASDMVKPQEEKEQDTFASLCSTARCKPMGVETVAYFDGKTVPAPEVKKTEAPKKDTTKVYKKKTEKKTTEKKTQQKKL